MFVGKQVDGAPPPNQDDCLRAVVSGSGSGWLAMQRAGSEPVGLAGGPPLSTVAAVATVAAVICT